MDGLTDAWRLFEADVDPLQALGVANNVFVADEPEEALQQRGSKTSHGSKGLCQASKTAKFEKYTSSYYD
eukprot:6492280-Amphidinium_carterae.9